MHNLFTDPSPGEKINVIFCRNVMIYFDKADPGEARGRDICAAIAPEGYLFIGHSESLSGFSKAFLYASLLKAPIYRRKKEGTQ